MKTKSTTRTTTAKTTASKTTKATCQITEEDIRKRAFEIYLSRGCKPGNPMEDWLKAEKELKGRKK